MEDELHVLRHQSGELQSLRRRIAGSWDDEAARELNLRYLNPHSDETEHMLSGCSQQMSALEKTNVSSIAAEQAATRVEALGLDILEQLDLADQDLMLSHQYVEQYSDSASRVQALFGRIDELLSQATAICEGVPKS